MSYEGTGNWQYVPVDAFGEASGGGINRQYKDRLFKALFGSPERKDLTLQLYNAMNGSSYTNPEEIQLTTIENVVYMGMRNDVSFLLGQTMSLWEQQSTRNPNMPLRLLLYYAHVMEQYVSELSPAQGSIYSSGLVHLPWARLVLFYNGPGRMPDHLYLSDAYKDDPDPDVTARVRVININSGQDRILELCQPLQDYTTFVESFSKCRAQGNVSDSVAASKAIAELPDGTVKNYLRAHESEVIDMLLTEYDEEKTLKAEYYVGKRDGHAEGYAEAEAEYEGRLAAKDAALADKDNEVAGMSARIAQLEAQLAEASQT